MNPVDLTLTLSKNLPTFPGSPILRFIPWSSIKKDGYNLELLFMSSHSGTHLDAPYHFLEKGSKIDRIPLKRLVVNAILLNLKKGSNQPITKKDIQNFEQKHFKIPKGSSLVFHTRWSENLQKSYYFTKNPGLSYTATQYLVDKKINLVGIDSPSIDLGSDTKFTAHHILLKNNILILENLTNLSKISSKQFKLMALPLKLKDATGSPVRAIAV